MTTSSAPTSRPSGPPSSWLSSSSTLTRDLIAATLLALLALALRTVDLGLLEFKGDEAVGIHLALPMAEGKALPQVGLMSSVGLHNPPLFIWLTALPVAFTVDPATVTAVLIGGLNVLAVVLTFWLFRNRLGFWPAVIAALLFAVSTWPVLYGRKLWAQDCLPPFSVLLLHVLLLVYEHRRTRWIAAAPVLACILWQLHFSGIPVVALTLAILAFRFRTLNYKALAAGFGLAVLLTVPYLQFQAGNGWPDVKGLMAMASGKKADGAPKDPSNRTRFDALQWTGYASVGADLGYSLGDSTEAFRAERSALGRTLGGVATWGGIVALGLGLAYWVAGLLRRQADARRPTLPVATVFLFGYISLMSVLGLDRIYPHYFIIVYPVPFLLAGVGLASGLRFGARGVVVSALATAAIVVGHIATLGELRSFLRAHGGAAGDYGVILEHKVRLADYAVTHGLKLQRAPGFEYGHLVDMRARYDGVIDESATIPRAPTSGRSLRVFDGLRQRSANGIRCRGRQDFGPLVTCPEP